MDERRQVAAAGLREVAQTRWDVDRDPVVTWSAGATAWWLVDPGRPRDRILLARLSTPVADPRAVARALAETVAACDFPPTDDRASTTGIRAALDAAGFRDVAAAMIDPAG